MSGKIRKTINVLLVDQAVTFGGSIVVMANIVNYMTDDVNCSVIYEVPRSVAEYLFSPSVRKRKVKNPLNYYVAGNIKEWLYSVDNKFLKYVLLKAFVLTKIMSSWLQVIRISRIIIQDRIDVVHSNNSLEALVAAKFLRRKLVAHLHGPGLFYKRPFLKKCPFIKNIDMVIAISDHVKEFYDNNDTSSYAMTVMPNPVIDKKPDQIMVQGYRKKYGILDSDKVFGIVGRIVDWKGHLQFLEAVNLVLKKMDGVKVLIIGDISDGRADYLDEVKSLISKYGMQEKVIITGYIEEVHNATALLDLLVHCSIEPEPFGLVITEAMIMSIPVVASNTGAPGEIIDEGETGYLVDPYDSEKLSQRILEILTDNELAKKMGDKAREVAVQKYSIENYISKLSSTYIEICNKK